MFDDKIYSLENAAASAANETVGLRCEAVGLRLRGWEVEAVAEELECSPRFVRKWSSIFRREGVRALLAYAGPGRKKAITDAALDEMRDAILATQAEATPARGVGIQALLHKAGYFIGLTSTYDALHRLDFSYKTARPVHPKRSEDAVQAWKTQLPVVLANVQEKNPEKKIRLFFQDETRFGMKGILTRQWSPIGERPWRERQMEYKNAWIFGAVEPSTGAHHGLVTTHAATDFMQAFVDSFAVGIAHDEHVVLVVDNAGWHVTGQLRVPENITLHFLPPYSPDLNPVETLWLFMKSNYLCNRIFGTLEEIMNAGLAAWGNLTNEICRSVCGGIYCKT
jgi:transposase